MIRPTISSIAVLLSVALASTAAWSQNPYNPYNPYGGSRPNTDQQRKIPTFGAGSDQQLPQTGTYQGSSNQLGRSQLSQTYPPAPRVRRPIISPYLNLNRPEGIVGGVPNYYSLVRPEVNAFNRYKQGVENFRQFEQDNTKRQQELYLKQQQDYDALKEKIEQDQANQQLGSRYQRTQYGRTGLRATGHKTSFGVR